MTPKPIRYEANPAGRQPDTGKTPTANFSTAVAASVQRFHAGLDGYAPTPLRSLDALAAFLGVAAVWVKDESHRFGLNAFKSLGATYALNRALASTTAADLPTNGFGPFPDTGMRAQVAAITCITATDGNHGRAVAWAAREAGCRCVVYLPSGSAPIRLENIRKLGAHAEIIAGNYDDAVRRAAREADENGWLLIQDTAMTGYEEIPRWVMQGYLTMFEEIFARTEERVPTHVLLQCGVGSFAAACQAHLMERFGEQRPRVVIVEPDRAACFYRSIRAGDGRPHPVTGTMDTIMAGLACGEPSPAAWEILKGLADMFVACPDRVAKRGMRVLGNPLPGDPRIISGESGAVTTGLLFEACRSENREFARAMGLDAHSRVLLISTEGDTDPDNYRRIVW